eukprot:4780154-Pleurochrysis_carterae.AAC.1
MSEGRNRARRRPSALLLQYLGKGRWEGLALGARAKRAVGLVDNLRLCDVNQRRSDWKLRDLSATYAEIGLG